MRTNKYAILITGGITIGSLIIAIVFHHLRLEFIANIFSGVFASGVLAVILAVIGYFQDRRETLEKFYRYAQKAKSNINRYDNDGCIEETIDTILLMNEFDYGELGEAYRDMCFLFHNKKLHDYIFNSIYRPILDISDLISEKSYHFKLHKKKMKRDSTDTWDIEAMKSFINEIDQAIMSRTNKQILGEHGKIVNMSFSENKVVFAIRRELAGKYYDIMYPWRKKEVSNDAD